MSSGPSKELIRANTGVEDPLIHNPSMSPFMVAVPLTMCNHIVSENEIRPVNSVTSWGQKARIEIAKEADRLGPCQAVFQLPALSQTDGARTYVQNLGMIAVKNIVVTYGSNKIVEIPAAWRFVRFKKYLGPVPYEAWRVSSRSDMTAGEIASLTANGGEMIVDLCLPFADDTSQWFHTIQSSQKLTLQIELAQASEVIQEAAAPSGDQGQQLTDFYVQAYVAHFTAAERKTDVKIAMKEHGYSNLIEDIQWQEFLVPDNAANHTLKLRLTNITRPVRSLFWFMTLNGYDAATTTHPFNTDDNNGGAVTIAGAPRVGEVWIRYRVVTGQNIVVPWTTPLRSRYVNHNRWFSGSLVGNYINNYSFGLNPETPNANTGSLNFGQIDAPTLEIEMNGFTTSDTNGINLTVIADTLNFTQEQGGDFSKTFH